MSQSVPKPAEPAAVRTESGGPARCAACGDILGVYEPLICVLPGGRLTLTSLAADPKVTRRTGAACFHRACWTR